MHFCFNDIDFIWLFVDFTEYVFNVFLKHTDLMFYIRKETTPEPSNNDMKVNHLAILADPVLNSNDLLPMHQICNENLE